MPETPWRRGRDSNPRSPLGDARFQGGCLQPDSATPPDHLAQRSPRSRLANYMPQGDVRRGGGPDGGASRAPEDALEKAPAGAGVSAE
jgi:hypothetical protein